MTVPVTLTTFTDDGTVDEHGDPGRDVDTKQTGVEAFFRQPSEYPRNESDNPLGQSGEADVVVWVADEYSDDVHAAGDVDDSGATVRYATRIERESLNKAYDVIRTWKQQTGLVEAAVKEV